MTGIHVSELFAAIADYTLATGHTNLAATPGVVTIPGPDGSTLRWNAHAEENESIPQFSVIVMKNGWPCVIAGPTGGACIGVSETEMLDLFKRANAELTPA
jgi:hypothetical protein